MNYNKGKIISQANEQQTVQDENVMIRPEMSDNKCDGRDETSVSGREGIRGELENDMPQHSSSVSLYSHQHKLLNCTFQTTIPNKRTNMDNGRV